jgi:type III secretion protein L
MSRVIKHGGSPGTSDTPDITSAQVFDARLEAERILKQAQADAERIRTQAANEGRERGLAAVTELLVGARAATARARSQTAGELRALAVRIAEKILGKELELRPEAVVDITAEALGGVGAARQVAVRCHPDDMAALERGRPRLLERCAFTHAVAFRVDERVSRGGCIVETELATIYARQTTQLEAIERALRGEEP